MSGSRWFAIGLLGCLSAACGSGSQGPAGPEGPQGSAGPIGMQGPSGVNGAPVRLTSISSAEGFLDRTLALQLGAVSTHFTNASTVDFGDLALSVSGVNALNDAALRLTLSIAPNARLGAHDITVTSGSEVVSLPGGFVVKAPAQFARPASPIVVPQGGFVPFSINNLDYRDNPFPTATSSATATGEFLVDFIHCNSPSQCNFNGLVDAKATVGKLGLAMTSTGPFGDKITFATDPADSNSPTAQARTPTVLSDGVAVPNQTFASNNATNLYQITTATNDRELCLSLESLGTVLQVISGNVYLGFAPASGKWSDGGVVSAFFHTGRILLLAPLPTAGVYYFSVRSAAGGTSAEFGHSAVPKLFNVVNVTLPAESGGGDSPGAPLGNLGALDNSKLTRVSGGILQNPADHDFVKFTVSSNATWIIKATTGNSPFSSIGNAYLYANTDCMSNPVSDSLNAAFLTAGTSYCLDLSTINTAVPYQLEFISP